MLLREHAAIYGPCASGACLWRRLPHRMSVDEPRGNPLGRVSLHAHCGYGLCHTYIGHGCLLHCLLRVVGCIVSLPQVALPRFGIEVKFAKDGAIADFEALIDARTKALYTETIGNPGTATTSSTVLRSTALRRYHRHCGGL